MEEAKRNEDGAINAPLFRSKKRKNYRQRAVSPNTQNEDANSATAVKPPSDQPGSATVVSPRSDVESGDEFEALSVSEALRLRKLRKTRAGGVQFGGVKPVHDTESQVMVPSQRHEEEKGGLDVRRRFVGQTGTVAQVDKHM